jgi:type IV pilus assembly protein PilE
MRPNSELSARRGFTLIELMIVVAIVAILATIALPAYTGYIQRGRIAEATNELAGQRIRLEQFYQDNKNYGSTAATCGTFPLGSPPNSAFFAYTCNWGAAGTNQGFTITATGIGQMNGFTYTIDQANLRQTTAFPNAGVPVNCWLRRPGDTC